jgi:hypothetical protein
MIYASWWINVTLTIANNRNYIFIIIKYLISSYTTFSIFMISISSINMYNSRIKCSKCGKEEIIDPNSDQPTDEYINVRTVLIVEILELGKLCLLKSNKI